jgi:ABC-type multidrug transport system fused ATPase/permease subunit
VAYTWLVRPQQMLASHLMGFGFVLLRLLPLLNHVYALQGQLFYYAGGLREIEASLQTPQAPAEPFGDRSLGPIRHGIALENVDYSYPSGKRALSGVSWVLPAGRTVALVGDSGSGKSTLVGLLLRFRAPGGGRITVDGVDYWSFTAQSWHRAVAVVEQEAFVFHDTLRANVALGAPAATDDAVRRALEVAQMSDVVAALPHGLDTVIGERGSTLSGGQRQRLALARALVREPDLLILDEATSALDPLSEAQLQRALAQARARRTVLVVAHRLATIRQADWIVVLREGRVCEQGTWDQLGQLHGWFGQVLQTEGAALAPHSPAPPLPAHGTVLGGI